MPAKKRSSSSRSSWSSGRAPAWVRERAPAKKSPAKKAAAKRTSAAAKRTGSGARKTTAARSTASRSTTARRTPAKRTATKSTARRTTTTRRTTATRATAPRRTEDVITNELLELEESPELLVPAVPGAEIPVAGDAEPAGIAIAGVTPSTLEAEEAPAVEQAPPTFEKRSEDPLLALLGLVLAGSVFLPWYKLPTGLKGSTVTGWQTGTWGPVIAFLGAAAFLLVALRRLKVAVALPFPESIMLEAIGWFATLTAIIKARFRPDYAEGFKFGLDNRIWVAVGAGLALALLAGRASGKTPFVSVPGWWRGKAGKLGLALLIVVVAGSAAFGLTNSYKGTVSGSPTGSGNPGAQANTVRGRLPDCAKGFPVPADVKPYSGSGSAATNTCVALLTTDKKAADVVTAYKAALTSAGYKFTQAPGNASAVVLKLSSPRCGTIQIVAIQQSPSTKSLGNTFVSLILTACAK